jgi:hypothetical protein
MRKIEFIAPVEAMRGNLSGNQKLTYPTQNNAAWDAPENKRSYATNYRPTYVGAKRSADGKTFFATKRRQAVKMSEAARLQMAVLSASSVIANILMYNLTVVSGLTERYKQTAPEGWSFKRWIMDNIKDALRNKQHFAFMGTSLGALFVKNPYLSTAAPAGGTSIDSSYPKDLLSKFWMQLADNPIQFKIGSQIGIAHKADDWDALANASYNTLNLTIVSGKVCKDTLYVQTADKTATPLSWDYVTDGDEIQDTESDYLYQFTTVAPV